MVLACPAPSVAREGDTEHAVSHAVGTGTVASRGLSRQDPWAGSWLQSQTQPSRDLELTGSAGAGSLRKEPLSIQEAVTSPVASGDSQGSSFHVEGVPSHALPSGCSWHVARSARGVLTSAGPAPVLGLRNAACASWTVLGTKDEVDRGEQEET